MFKNALVSVTDKTGLVEFLQPFVSRGMRVVSTGGTAEHLRTNGIAVIEVRDQTGFPEVMDGRVRTLHPRVHMALLARSWDNGDMSLLKEQGLEPFDLVVGNLYQFHKVRGKGLNEREVVDHIDIGGPALLRASAKNFDRITVACDPYDYSWISQKTAGGTFGIQERKQLAAKVFSHISNYDAMVASELSTGEKASNSPGAVLAVSADRVQELRYGENPHQWGTWYKSGLSHQGLHTAEILQGKELSFNNLLDLEAATSTVREFCLPTTVIVKHNNPCGVASDAILSESCRKAIAADPISAFGGIVALNRELDSDTASLLAELFLECIVAPNISPAAKKVLAAKKNLRVLEWHGILQKPLDPDIRSIAGGFLVQAPDALIDWKDSWTVHGNGLSTAIKTELIFAFRCCAHLKSNAIVLSSGQQTVGMGMGQVNRVDAVRQALVRMRHHFPSSRETREIVLASDAFFPFSDSIDVAHEAGVKWVVQPGGAKKDLEILARAKELGIGMVLTGERHFRH